MKKLKKIFQVIIVLAVVFGSVQAVTAQGWSETMYYPLYMLSTAEYWDVSYLAPGTVIVVQPNASWWGSNVTKYTTAENSVRTNTVRNIVMAGVGSSSRGTAAMARLVAREINAPVAGIVTGRGDFTTLNQALEGYYTARIANQNNQWYKNPASSKLYDLYLQGARPFRVIGHSKGAMDSANTLLRLDRENRRIMGSTTFITFGMGVFAPANRLYNFRQYMGTADALGAENTVNTNPMIFESRRGHSLSPAMSMHVPVTGRLHR